MARKQSVSNLIHTNLKDRISFGQSKHAAKAGLGFGVSTYKIYSYETYNTYLKECLQYAKWLEDNGMKKTDSIEKTEQYAQEYLRHREEEGVSVYTLKMERSALGMLYGKTIDYKLPIRNSENITRSRREVENDRHYSRTGKYKDVFTVALATGCRRSDLKKLTPSSFVEKDGHLYVKIEQSKGGRDRIAYVLDEYRNEVENIIQSRQGQTKIFDKIPQKIDVHGLRREYCQNLYNEIKDNKELRSDILKNYPVRHEYKIQKDKDGNTYTKEIESTTYRDRDGNIYDRDDVYVCSQCLGHNRLDVSITHYLKS